MLYILHFIRDVTTFKEINPDKLFVHRAANDPFLMQKTMKVIGDGIRRYLEYAIELKEKQPELFDQVVSDYQLLAGGGFATAVAHAGPAAVAAQASAEGTPTISAD